MTRALLLVVALSLSAQAASRGRYGGTLKLALASRQTEADPLLADTPSEAALLGLLTRSVCRLDRVRGQAGVLTFDAVRPSQDVVRLTARPGLRFGNDLPVGAKEIAQSLSRAAGPSSASPYRALLFPLKGEGKKLSSSVTSRYGLDLTLAFPWPDLERSLCHPALAIVDARSDRLFGVGPFRPAAEKGSYLANPAFPEGRPYADQLTVTATDERGAARLLSLRKAQVALGGADEGAGPAGPALYATYLAFKGKAVGGEFRAAFESAIDRTDLTRFFVRAPAVPMVRLLPPALQAGPDPLRPSGAQRSASPREVTLLFDQSLDDQRAVAERLQVKLHDRGYKVALKGLPRSALRTRWAAGDFELMLHSLLLPPAPAPALAVVIDAAGRHDLLATVLPPLGAVSDAAARDARAREASDALSSKLELLPLYAQGLRVTVSREVVGLTQDAQGLPTLDAAFLQGE
ncbi:MAG: ABC transporter substrate-binding protein [Myxococcaceae bacterium]